MDGIYLIVCLAMIVFLALVALVIVILNSGSKEETQTTAEKLRRRTNTGWQSTFAFISISLVIALWTVWGALFFLAVVWMMRQNPGVDSSFTITEKEKKLARGIYMWLLLSPVLVLPVFVGMLINFDFPEADTNTHALITMIPLIFHVPLVTGLTSKSAFVYRHTQQAILLIALRVGVATLAISVGSYPMDRIWLFLLGNGSLWLLGSLWGLDQVSRGECWLMKQKGERRIMKNERAEDLSPQIHLEQSREFMERYNAAEAKKHALTAFRSRDREVRLQAVRLLSALHEVEEF